MARTQAVYYRDSRGAEPVNEFIQALPRKRAAKVDDFIEEHLNGRPADEPPPGFPVTSQLEGELRELRVRFANTRYRILYQRSENLVVLLHAVEKDTGGAAFRHRACQAADGGLQAPDERSAAEAAAGRGQGRAAEKPPLSGYLSGWINSCS